MQWWEWVLVVVAGGVVGLAIYDVVQTKHALLRSFPVVGHLRYLLEAIGPELRQYIVTDNDAEKPFNRDQRRWIYSAAKGQNTYFGFGTDNDLENSSQLVVVKQVAFPLDPPGAGAPGGPPDHAIPSLKVAGGPRGRRHAAPLRSVVNISSMSYGSLSAPAVQALNEGARLAGCLQGTGEGGLTEHHRHGGELVWQIGTGYFGCRDDQGRFSLERFRDVVAGAPMVRGIEIKLSQGAKPGLGGILPGKKVTPEIASVRGVRAGVDCISPPGHSAFHDADSLLDFVEALAEVSGLPVGIKSAVGDETIFRDLARQMESGERGVDFVNIDGGEGGTGAGPLVFTDHVALPFKVGFSRVYRIFAEAGITDRILFVGGGRLGLPENALLAFALGCDAVSVGREAMFAIGCIQAQRCHTDRCPTGITTHSRWLTRGLDPEVKAVRCADYLVRLREELLQLSHACGRPHPSLVTLDAIEVLGDRFDARPAREVFGYEPGWGTPTSS